MHMYPLHTFLCYEKMIPIAPNHPYTLLKGLPDTATLRQIAADIRSEYLLFHTGRTSVTLSEGALARLIQVAEMSRADLVYSDYASIEKGQRLPHPTLEYQSGSLRDDFDFGPLLLYRATAFRQAVSLMDSAYQYAALYDLRLNLSRIGHIMHLPEILYTTEEEDLRTSGEKQFDYVNPRNRDVQIEMEKACTAHLKNTGAWLAPEFRPTDPGREKFAFEASVIIPVKNRIRTIADAVMSALCQQTILPFNIIVVDNHSDDGTTEIVSRLARQNPALVHHIPARKDLGIGGCWNEAVRLPCCGKFSIQLDSDDLYNSPQVVQTIIDTFYKQNCAMVIGSYQMVDFSLTEIPPGIIDHREWTPDNGHNNALRINGLGAPRAFYTPILRQIEFPDVSYGEDYAVGLAISGEYRIGRIYEPLYLCRRWEENSDAAPGINRLNTYNYYKDKLRTLEMLKRIHRNGK